MGNMLVGDRPVVDASVGGEVVFRTYYGSQLLTEFSVSATGGTETVIEQEGLYYRVHTFLESGTLTVTRGGQVEFLVVGAGGASHHGASGNGGGAGGSVRQGQITLAAGDHEATVGQGGKSGYSGSGAATPSEPSSFGGILAPPGGFGAGAFDPATEGGGGSAGNDSQPPGAINTDTGHKGGDGAFTQTSDSHGGGGAGAGGDGEDATLSKGGDGGPGIISDIDGTAKGYGGGGGGAARSSGSTPGSGADGGGDGNAGGGGNPGYSGEPNTGGGTGGGLAGSEEEAPTAGSGIVIVRYRITEAEYLAEAA